jgi:hypothetical protein
MIYEWGQVVMQLLHMAQPAGNGEKISLAGAMAGAVGLAFASISPESFATWVSVVCSSAAIATSFALAIWHKIEDQRRAEFTEWKRVRGQMSDDDVHSAAPMRPIPLRFDNTPDPDRSGT